MLFKLFLILSASSFGAIPFNDALKTIVTKDPAYRSLKWKLEALLERDLPTKLVLLPDLSLQGTGQKSNTNFFQSQTGVAATSNLNLFRFGGDYYSIRSTNLDEDSARSNLKDAELKAEEEGAKKLLLWLQYSKEVETQEGFVSLYLESLNVAEERFKRGFLSQQEVDKVLVDLNNAKAKLSDSQTSLNAAESDLKQYLDSLEIEKTWPWKNKITEMGTAQAPKVDLSQRPDWQASEQKLFAEDARISQTRTKLLPSLDVSASYGYYWSQINPQFGQSGTVTGPQWQGTVTLTIPLFDKLSNYGNYRAQVFTKAAAEADLEKVKWQAKADWESASKNLRVSVESALLREKTLLTANKLYKDNMLRFKKGLANANELNLDQTRLLDSEKSSIEGWSQAHQTFSRYCHSVGKSIEECLK